MVKFWNSIIMPLVPLRKQVAPLAYVIFATTLNNLAGFVVSIVAAKKLGAEGFGILSLAFSVAVLTGVIGDMGFNLTTIRLYNKYHKELSKQTIVLGIALGLKYVLFIFLALISIPLGNLLSRILGTDITHSNLFAIALVTGGSIFLWAYLQSYLQAHHLFNRLAKYILAYFGLRVIFLLVTYYFFTAEPLYWLLATYTAPVFLLVLFGVAAKGLKTIAIVFKQPIDSMGILREMLNYSKWVTLSSIAYTAMPYAVRFILAARASLEEVGIFSVGMSFASAFFTLNNALRMVVFPKVTGLEGRDDINKYLTKLIRLVPHYTAFAILGIVILGSLQYVVLGEEYARAMPVFLVTASAFAAVVFLGMGTMLVHTMMRPEVEAYIEIARLTIVIVGSYFFAPAGAFWVAVVFAFSMVGFTAAKLLVVRRWLRE